jgi:integrase
MRKFQNHDATQNMLARRRLPTNPGCTHELIFVNSRGQTMSNYRKALAAISKSSGVTASPHDLRSTFASIAEGLDISGYSLKRRLNHTSGDVT